MQEIIDGYASAATADFIAMYDSLSTADIYQHVIDLIPNQGVKVADIGAGTGRDAAWFAEKGHDVLAIEPVRELRDAGQILHSAPNIRWLDDRLPELRAVPPGEQFNLVILSAVWQHIPDENRATAMSRLTTIISPNGMLILSLRHGLGAAGRKVFPISTDMTISMASTFGLRLKRKKNAESIQATNLAMGVSWTWLVFEKSR
jgi:2-polyprenyl-3-methyl-5-hydroxy-6-metoxy-1,4-benzoquinol methylase